MCKLTRKDIMYNVPRKAVVESLCCSKANNGVNDSCSIYRGDAIDDRDDHCILFTVVTKGKRQFYCYLQCSANGCRFKLLKVKTQ